MSQVGVLVTLSVLWTSSADLPHARLGQVESGEPLAAPTSEALAISPGETLAAHRALARKCAQSVATSKPYIPLIAVDGVVIGPAGQPDSTGVVRTIAWSRFVDDPKQIHSYTVECMNPQDSTFGATVGIGIISVWTYNGPIASVESVLARIQTAQREHFRAHSRYLVDLDGIDVSELPANVQVEYEVTDTGWAVQATFTGKMMRCQIDAATPAWTGDPRESLCRTQ